MKLPSLRGAMKLAVAGASLLMLANCAGDGPTTRSAAAASVPRSQPNIIVIMADDLGYADVSTYPGGRIPTPNIDRLGRDGVVFTQGYVTAPICSPSRAGMMTGRHQQRFGFEFNNGPDSRDIAEHLGLDPAEVTLAQALRDGGYRTGAIGKWHLGSNDEHYPTRRGFDEWWGFLTGQTNYIDPSAPDAVNAVPPPRPGQRPANIAQAYASVEPANAVITGPDRRRVDLGQGFLTEQITDQAISFIDRNADRPFFLHLAHHAPHTPLQVTQKYYDRFPSIENHRDRVYAAMVSALDDGVGAVLDHLEKRGLAQNTLVIFMSDNGCAAYVPGLCSAESLSGGKLTHFEGGIRVPFVMRWPARIKPHSLHDRPISSMDVFPTAMAAAGLDLPSRTYDGFDLLPQLATGGATWTRPAMFWRSTPVRTVRDGDFKYHRDFDGQVYLFNLRTDPKETTNLALKEPGRVKALEAKFAQWEADKAPPAWPGRYIAFDFGGRHFKFNP